MIDDEYTARMRQVARPEPEPIDDLYEVEHDETSEAVARSISEVEQLSAIIAADTHGIRR